MRVRAFSGTVQKTGALILLTSILLITYFKNNNKLASNLNQLNSYSWAVHRQRRVFKLNQTAGMFWEQVSEEGLCDVSEGPGVSVCVHERGYEYLCGRTLIL